jgi:replicative DNA helicase
MSNRDQIKVDVPLKVPPQNLEAEQSVLGSLMIDKDAVLKVSDSLLVEDFYREDHALIYEAMLNLYSDHTPIDILTISNELDKKKKLKQIGGATYLSTLVNTVPTAAHVAHYAEIVHKKAVLRRLISAASSISQMGYDEVEDIDSLLDNAESKLFGVSQKFNRQYFTPIKAILTETFDRIDDLHKNKGKVRGVASGFRDLDNILAGLQPSDLIILAARPSMGKTSLALNIAQHVAVKEKIPVAVFSLEQSKEQLVDRLLCGEAGIDAWKLRTGNLTENDFPKIGYAMGMLSEAPLFIDDTPMQNVMEIRTKARRLQMEHGLGLIVIDYLQLMSGRNTSYDSNRVQEISEISRGLKGLARELDVPVIALSQLNRAVEQRPDKRPQLSDLRDSGSIEQDADVVLFIYREDYYNPETDRKGISEILVRKHRNGPIGSIELFFIGEQTRFRTMEKKITDIQL